MIPVCEPEIQFPEVPWGMTGRAVHEVLAQAPETTQIPEVHVAERVPEKSALQIRVHMAPFGESETQSPILEFGIFGRPEQIF